MLSSLREVKKDKSYILIVKELIILNNGSGDDNIDTNAYIFVFMKERLE